MSQETVISVSNLRKEFKLPHQRADSLKNVFTNILKPGSKIIETQVALQGINFEIKKGEFFGIVGRNGSGKSTMLKLLAGIYQPTKGSLHVSGRIVPFIELGVGFNGELTGRENVYLNGALMGFSEKEIKTKYQDIVEFAELERFMDQKLKNYSSGMQVRLAFSVATRMAESDILLIDEVLAGGDADFQRKCFHFFKQLKKQKKTVIFVTHDMNAVREYCDRAILIDDSRLIRSGKPDKIASLYTRMFMDHDNQSDDEDSVRWGDGVIKYESVAVHPKAPKENSETIKIRADVKAYADVAAPIFGFSIKNSSGVTLLGTNTKILNKPSGGLKKGQVFKLEWDVQNIFEDGEYYVSVAAVHPDGVTTYDWWDEAVSFRAYREQKGPYIVAPKIAVEVG